MTVTELAERIRISVSEQIGRSRQQLDSVGLTWSEPELVVSRHHANEYTAELKVVFYRDGELVDIFEFIVCNEGVMKTTEDDVRLWIQTNLPDVVGRQKRQWNR